jgi:hypothetical protein
MSFAGLYDDGDIVVVKVKTAFQRNSLFNDLINGEKLEKMVRIWSRY